MSSIKYDSVELVNATYIPRYAKHETAPERIINSMKLARQDGEVIIDDTFGVKYVDIHGTLKGSSQSDLESKIDDFKELINRKDKNLDIVWAGGTRRYVCRSISHDFNRDFFHLLHCPYNIRFLVFEGIGKDITSTTALNDTGITVASTQNVVNFSGSYKSKAKHKITITTRGNADVLKIENEDSDEYMEVNLDGFSNGDYVEIDEENLTVKKNGSTDIDYYGKFPSVELGNNNLKLTISGNGYTLDQNYEDGIILGKIYDNTGTSKFPTDAQSFIPTKSGRIGKIATQVAKVDGGSLAGNLDWYIHHDDNNKPSTVIVGGYRYQILQADVPASPNAAFIDADYTGAHGDAPFLVKDTRYWVKLLETSINTSDASNYYSWVYGTASPYTDGKSMARGNSSENWEDGSSEADESSGISQGNFDKNFKIYIGDGNSPSWSVIWNITYIKKYL